MNRDETLRVRVTKEEYEQIERAAIKMGLSISSYVRYLATTHPDKPLKPKVKK